METYIVIDEIEIPVDTLEQIEEAEKIMREEGIDEAIVWAGDGPDAVKTGQKIVLHDDAKIISGQHCTCWVERASDNSVRLYSRHRRDESVTWETVDCDPVDAVPSDVCGDEAKKLINQLREML